MATDMDIDMDLDIGLDEDLGAPEIEFISDIDIPVSLGQSCSAYSTWLIHIIDQPADPHPFYSQRYIRYTPSKIVVEPL